MKKLAILLLTIGCTRHLPPETKHYSVPEKLQPYIEEFEEDSVKYGKPITIDNLDVIIVVNLPFNIGGVCNIGEGIPLIRLNYMYVDNIEMERRILFHELGHCVLGRPHDDRMAPWGPASLMNTFLIDANMFHNHQDYYLNELFNPEK